MKKEFDKFANNKMKIEELYTKSDSNSVKKFSDTKANPCSIKGKPSHDHENKKICKASKIAPKGIVNKATKGKSKTSGIILYNKTTLDFATS